MIVDLDETTDELIARLRRELLENESRKRELPRQKRRLQKNSPPRASFYRSRVPTFEKSDHSDQLTEKDIVEDTPEKIESTTSEGTNERSFEEKPLEQSDDYVPNYRLSDRGEYEELLEGEKIGDEGDIGKVKTFSKRSRRGYKRKVFSKLLQERNEEDSYESSFEELKNRKEMYSKLKEHTKQQRKNPMLSNFENLKSEKNEGRYSNEPEYSLKSRVNNFDSFIIPTPVIPDDFDRFSNSLRDTSGKSSKKKKRKKRIKSYLKRDVFDRLATTKSIHPQNSYRNKLKKMAKQMKKRSRRKRSQSFSYSPSSKTFNSFLRRVELDQLRRIERREQLEEATGYSFRPQTNVRSYSTANGLCHSPEYLREVRSPKDILSKSRKLSNDIINSCGDLNSLFEKSEEPELSFGFLKKKKSRKVLKKKERDFIKKMEDGIAKREERRKMIRKKYNTQNFSFKPKINKSIDIMHRRFKRSNSVYSDNTKYERSVSPWLDRRKTPDEENSEGIKRMSKRMAYLSWKNREKFKECTFHPNLKKSSRSAKRLEWKNSEGFSNLGIDLELPVNMYVKRIQRRVDSRQRKLDGMKEREEEEMMRECTFRPKIRDAPGYVKKIARSSRREKELERKNNKVKQKPKWI